MKINFKKLSKNAVTPSYAHEGDACLDLTATSKSFDEYGNVVYGTGIAIELKEDQVGLLFPRSSNSKKDLILTNSVGVLDYGFTSEITFKFKSNLSAYVRDYNVGDRIGQILILPRPYIEMVEFDKLREATRGSYGSTGA